MNSVYTLRENEEQICIFKAQSLWQGKKTKLKIMVWVLNDNVMAASMWTEYHPSLPMLPCCNNYVSTYSIRWTVHLFDSNTIFCKCVLNLYTKYSMILIEVDADYIFPIFFLVSSKDYDAASLTWFICSFHTVEKSLLTTLSLYIIIIYKLKDLVQVTLLVSLRVRKQLWKNYWL